MLICRRTETLNTIDYILILCICFSLIKEIINIPLIELNQIFLIGALILFLYINKKRGIIGVQITISQLSILLLISYIVIQGIILSVSYVDFFRMIKNYVLGLFFIMGIMSMGYRNYVKIIKIAVKWMTIIFTLEYFLYMFAKSGYNILFYEPYANIRHVASFLSPNSYAIVLAFVITYYVNKFILKGKKTDILLGALLFLPLISTYSKSGMFITLSGVLLSMWFSNKKHYKLIVIIVIINVAGLIVSGNIENILKQFPNSYFARRFLLYFEEGTLGGERGEGYLELINIFKENWLIGVGFGNITGNNDIYQGFSSAHNEYLRFLVEGGIIGGGIFLTIVIALIRRIINVYSMNKINKENCIFAIWGILFLLSEMFYNYFNAPREGILLIFMGFSVFTINNSIKEPVIPKRII